MSFVEAEIRSQPECWLEAARLAERDDVRATGANVVTFGEDPGRS